MFHGGERGSGVVRESDRVYDDFDGPKLAYLAGPILSNVGKRGGEYT